MFQSFFLAGYECATGRNRHGQWIDQIAATQHDRFVNEDYIRLREVGIRAAREGIRWPLVDRRGRYDFSTVQPFLDAARRHGIELIHDLFHYGFPDDVDLFSDEFPKRFADYCYTVARYVSKQTDGKCYFTPVNEPSYFSWAAGEAGLFAPHARGRGRELKMRLIQAAIQGINAIWEACPEARIVNVDPLCRVVAPPGNPELEAEAEKFNTIHVFESWDMLAGRVAPELGGSSRHLDIIGINYYWTNQWELFCSTNPLSPDDVRCWPLSRLIKAVWERYGRELIISETSHVNEMRHFWLRELVDETEKLILDGVQLHGICLYPILGMPEWHAQHEWTRMGLWDLVHEGDILKRMPYQPMMEALREAQTRLECLVGPPVLDQYLSQAEVYV